MGIGIGFDLIGVYNVEHNITSYETEGICDVFSIARGFFKKETSSLLL